MSNAGLSNTSSILKEKLLKINPILLQCGHCNTIYKHHSTPDKTTCPECSKDALSQYEGELSELTKNAAWLTDTLSNIGKSVKPVAGNVASTWYSLGKDGVNQPPPINPPPGFDFVFNKDWFKKVQDGDLVLIWDKKASRFIVGRKSGFSSVTAGPGFAGDPKSAPKAVHNYLKATAYFHRNGKPWTDEEIYNYESGNAKFASISKISANWLSKLFSNKNKPPNPELYRGYNQNINPEFIPDWAAGSYVPQPEDAPDTIGEPESGITEIPKIDAYDRGEWQVWYSFLKALENQGNTKAKMNGKIIPISEAIRITGEMAGYRTPQGVGVQTTPDIQNKNLIQIPMPEGVSNNKTIEDNLLAVDEEIAQGRNPLLSIHPHEFYYQLLGSSYKFFDRIVQYKRQLDYVEKRPSLTQVRLRTENGEVTAMDRDDLIKAAKTEILNLHKSLIRESKNRSAIGLGGVGEVEEDEDPFADIFGTSTQESKKDIATSEPIYIKYSDINDLEGKSAQNIIKTLTEYINEIIANKGEISNITIYDNDPSTPLEIATDKDRIDEILSNLQEIVIRVNEKINRIKSEIIRVRNKIPDNIQPDVNGTGITVDNDGNIILELAVLPELKEKTHILYLRIALGHLTSIYNKISEINKLVTTDLTSEGNRRHTNIPITDEGITSYLNNIEPSIDKAIQAVTFVTNTTDEEEPVEYEVGRLNDILNVKISTNLSKYAKSITQAIQKIEKSRPYAVTIEYANTFTTYGYEDSLRKLSDMKLHRPSEELEVEKIPVVDVDLRPFIFNESISSAINIIKNTKSNEVTLIYNGENPQTITREDALGILTKKASPYIPGLGGADDEKSLSDFEEEDGQTPISILLDSYSDDYAEVLNQWLNWLQNSEDAPPILSISIDKEEPSLISKSEAISLIKNLISGISEESEGASNLFDIILDSSRKDYIDSLKSYNDWLSNIKDIPKTLSVLIDGEVQTLSRAKARNLVKKLLEKAVSKSEEEAPKTEHITITLDSSSDDYAATLEAWLNWLDSGEGVPDTLDISIDDEDAVTVSKEDAVTLLSSLMSELPENEEEEGEEGEEEEPVNIILDSSSDDYAVDLHKWLDWLNADEDVPDILTVSIDGEDSVETSKEDTKTLLTSLLEMLPTETEEEFPQETDNSNEENNDKNMSADELTQISSAIANIINKLKRP